MYNLILNNKNYVWIKTLWWTRDTIMFTFRKENACFQLGKTLQILIHFSDIFPEILIFRSIASQLKFNWYGAYLRVIMLEYRDVLMIYINFWSFYFYSTLFSSILILLFKTRYVHYVNYMVFLQQYPPILLLHIIIIIINCK